MFAPLSPILAADTASNDDAQDVLDRIEAVATALSIVARLAGVPYRPAFGALSRRADLSAILTAAAPCGIDTAGRDLVTLGIELHAGLLALEKARMAGRLNRRAAALLHDEASASYCTILAALGYTTTH
ncbi:hypothetical protein [Blastomonas aquatica]|uniref:Uncharacterized protein n=1 Tax=Blastomonas aquatica TaxID=1510276 RepID=A0ABQ1IV23_9SPHN|nr:hypothetical protein [Blastomonas aquatica]GGB51989.1 hypothetical protein GCM10010833_03430 [Blastomonas aquatica]